MRLVHVSHALAVVLLLAGAAQAAPQRVVSAFLCTDEYVFRLVPRDRIAALSWLAGDTNPVVSTIADQVRGIPLIHPSAEAVLSLRPDLVVMYANTNLRLHEQLAAAGIAVLDVPWANSFSDVRKITLMLGRKLGALDASRRLLGKMESDLAAARRKAIGQPMRVLIYEPNGYATGGGITEDVLSAANLRDMAGSLGLTRLNTIPVEAVVTHPPDLLLLNGGERVARTRADLVLHHPALEALKQKMLIASVDLTALLCPGPWSTAAAKSLAESGHQARLLATRHRAP